jgi:two-component system sensor histidine kinase CreC
MRLTVKIPLVFFSVLGLALGFFAYREADEARRRYREATEEPLIDTAHILAAFIESSATLDALISPMTRVSLEGAGGRLFRASVYDAQKTSVDLRVYVTNKDGIVVYDSARNKAEGENYGGWRDVALTLRGEYGARSTLEKDPALGKVLYVAAPIRLNGTIQGVVSVGKPTRNVDLFLKKARRYTYLVGLGIFLAGVALASLLVLWVSRPLRLLTVYAQQIRDGRAPALPNLSSADLQELGFALEEMRVALQGKHYVERYVTSLTHELKSPLTGIKGAVELLRDELSGHDRERFLNNIERESSRMQTLIEKLLTLATIQRTGELVSIEEVDLVAVLREVLDDYKGGTTVELRLAEHPAEARVAGNHIWLKEAFSNVVSNAIEFSPPDGVVSVEISVDALTWTVRVIDHGPGIPDWAKARVFDSFFSLPRPISGKRSSGLGLTLVREIMEAMGGGVSIQDSPSTGATVIVTGSTKR